MAIKKLKRNHDIVIKKANKGSIIVIEDKVNYIKEGKRHLADSATYQLLQGDPTSELVAYITRIASELYNARDIDKYTQKFITPPKTRTQCLYFLKNSIKTRIRSDP